jgi:hypothetical protein
MALHSGFQKVNSFTFNDLGDSLAQKKWFFGGLGPWNVKLGLSPEERARLLLLQIEKGE